MTNGDVENVAPRRIAVIDDDLAPQRFATLDEDLRNALGDANSPVFEALWGFALAQGHVAETGDEAERLEHVCSNDFVQTVLLHPNLADVLPDVFNQHVAPLIELRRQTLAWYECVKDCFSDDTYEIVEHASRPSPSDVMECDGIVLDLIMDDDEPFGAVVDFLERLYDTHRENNTRAPSVILISRTAEPLERHRDEFRSKGKVSASALRLVDKAELGEASQGNQRFRLLWAQMQDERTISAKLSQFGHALQEGLDQSCELVNRSYWNLDGDALLRIYRTCIAEGDVFADHLLELLCRDLVWHLREADSIRSGADRIEAALEERIATKDGGPPRRFYVSNEEDGEAFRSLIHHFYWLPYGSPLSLSDLPIKDLKKQPARYLPFGAVLARDTPDIGVDVLIHTTQPCDLLRFGDESKSERFRVYSLQFSTGQLSQYLPDRTRIIQRYAVIPGISSTSRFNIDVDFRRPLSLPASRMFLSLRRSGYSVIGVLRPEVTQSMSIGQQSYSGRPAAPAFLDVSIESFRLQLQHGGLTVDIDNGDIANFPAVVEFDGEREGSKPRRIVFLGNSPQKIAARCCHELAQIDAETINLDSLAESLRDGVLVKDGKSTSLNDDFQVLSCRNESHEQVEARLANNPQQGKSRLSILPEG